jgi:hypothetical protein
MFTALIGKHMLSPAKIADDNLDSGEVMVFCPACKTFETIWINNSRLNQTRRFAQIGGRIYHDCSSNEPCRLYANV